MQEQPPPPPAVAAGAMAGAAPWPMVGPISTPAKAAGVCCRMPWDRDAGSAPTLNSPGELARDSWDLKSALSMNFTGSPFRLRFCRICQKDQELRENWRENEHFCDRCSWPCDWGRFPLVW